MFKIPKTGHLPNTALWHQISKTHLRPKPLLQSRCSRCNGSPRYTVQCSHHMGNLRPLANTCQCHSSRNLRSAQRNCEQRHYFFVVKRESIWIYQMDQLSNCKKTHLFLQYLHVSPHPLNPLDHPAPPAPPAPLRLRRHSWPPSRSAAPRCKSLGSRPRCCRSWWFQWTHNIPRAAWLIIEHLLWKCRIFGYTSMTYETSIYIYTLYYINIHKPKYSSGMVRLFLPWFPMEFHRRDSVNGTHSAKSPEPQVLAVSLLQITGQYQSSAPRLWRLAKKPNKKTGRFGWKYGEYHGIQ